MKTKTKVEIGLDSITINGIELPLPKWAKKKMKAVMLKSAREQANFFLCGTASKPK